MNPPNIFISATSGDLGRARQIAKEALLTINCHPVEQTNFGPDWRTVTDMLREKISGCQALIHIVGFRYGVEPDPDTLPPGTPRRSYTQMEYHIARELGLRVYTFLLSETYPYDVPAQADTPEQTQLQAAHRALIQSSPHLYEKPANDLDLRTRIIALQEKVIGLEQEQQSIATEVKTTRSWGVWAAAAIVLILGGIGWAVHHVINQNRDLKKNIGQVQTDVAEVKNLFTQERKFMALIIGRVNKRLKDWETMSPAQRFDLALDEISAEEDIPSQELRDLLDLYVQRIEADPAAEFEDKYNVLMRKQDYEEAAQLASTDGQSAENRMNQQAAREKAAQAIQTAAAEQKNLERQRAIDSYQKEGAARFADLQYEKALAAYQKAAALVDKNAAQIAWADAQGEVAFILKLLARHREAEPLMREILRLRELHQGTDHHEVATVISILAMTLQATNRLAEAEPLMERALKIDEAKYGPNHPAVARDLNNLALLLHATNRLAEADPLYRRALKMDEALYGLDHPAVAIRLGNLAALLQQTNSLVEAEPLYRRALKINEASYGPDHPAVATALSNLGQLLLATNQVAEAEPLMRRALKIDEASYRPDHPNVARDLTNLAQLLKKTNQLVEAEPLMKRALKINEASYGPDHPDVATALNNLAQLLKATNQLVEAEPLMRRALKIDEASYGPDHPDVARDLNNLASLYYRLNRLEEAEPLMRRALKIDEASNSPDHPNVARDLTSLAALYYRLNRLEEAEPLMRRALKIDEASYGPDHPNVARELNNLASLLQATHRLADAEPLMRRALKIDEASYGPDHPDVARDLNNLAQLLQATNRLAEAEPLMLRHVGIFLRFQVSTGHRNPRIVLAVENYLRLARLMGVGDREIKGRMDALRVEVGLDQAAFEGIWAEVLAKNAR